MNPRNFGALEGGFGPNIDDISRALREKFPGEFRQGDPVHAPSAFPEFKYRPDSENRVGRGVHSVYGVSTHNLPKFCNNRASLGSKKKPLGFRDVILLLLLVIPDCGNQISYYWMQIPPLTPKTGKVLPRSTCEGSRAYLEDPSSGPFPSSRSRSIEKRTRSSPASQGTRCRKTPRT
jgi:hypothetical protein